MHVFSNRAELDRLQGGATKWARTGQALDAAPGLLEDVTYSVGDSLTYRWTTTDRLAMPDLVGRRRYLLVVAPLDGDVHVEVAPVAQLTARADYDDLSDRQCFDGTGDLTVVPAGGILVVDIDEAARILPTPRTAAVVLHVTVEGATFHNK
jgi:evolved beta-galactosidase subunit beta